MHRNVIFSDSLLGNLPYNDFMTSSDPAYDEKLSFIIALKLVLRSVVLSPPSQTMIHHNLLLSNFSLPRVGIA